MDSLFGEVMFIPTPDMRSVKSRLILALEDNPIATPETMTCASAMHLTNEPRIGNWWSIPGFKEWFTNQNEFRETVESAAYEAVAVLREIATNPDSRENARVQASKLLIEAANRMPKKNAEEKFSDEQINRMSKEQLESFITNQIKKLEKSPDE